MTPDEGDGWESNLPPGYAYAASIGSYLVCIKCGAMVPRDYVNTHDGIHIWWRRQ